jgi:hypothetical protein
MRLNIDKLTRENSLLRDEVIDLKKKLFDKDTHNP